MSISWIVVPYWWHATLLEALWLAGGVLAGAITLGNLLDTWKDNQALDEIRDDPAVHERHFRMIELAASARIANQSFRLAICACIIVPGVYGCLTANPLQGKTTVTGFVLTGCLVAISACTAWMAFADRRRRNKLYEMATGRSAVIAARMKARNKQP